MSKITNPTTESSVTCGFFNSVVVNNKSDRVYNAEQMSSIFDGLINDGVFASIGDNLVVTASSGNVVSVGTGKCWFNHTWTLNDAPLLITCDPAETLQTRIDAIVVEVNTLPSVRDNFIKYIKGDPSQYNPAKPALKENEHALCYITRKPGSSAITNADIENVVGTDETPFVTGIVQVTSLDKLLGQWRQELDDFIATGENKFDDFIADKEIEFDEWYAIMKQNMADVTAELNNWTVAEKTMITNWFNEVKGQLSEDPALKLQMQIDADEVERLLMEGLPDGTKTFSDDGTVVKSVDSKGRSLTKTFTNNFLTITSVLKDREDKEYLPYPYSTFDGSTTKTINGITFTDNGDGRIKANGTATADVRFIISNSDFTLDPDTYGLSGCPVGGSEETYYFGAELYNGDTYVSNSTKKDTGHGVMLDLNDKTYTKVSIFIWIKSGVTVDNVIFNPSVNITGSVLGTLVKKISADGKNIENTLTNNSDTVPNLVEIERAVDAIIANENSYIEG